MKIKKKHVLLFVIIGRPECEEAFEQLKTLPNVKIQLIGVPESMDELYPVPFLKEEKGAGFYGRSGIDYYIGLQRSSQIPPNILRRERKKRSLPPSKLTPNGV